MLRRALLIGLACFAAGCGDSASTGQGGATGRDEVDAKVHLEVLDLAGIDGVLAQHRGRAVVLNFWATWCGPCVEELPDLVEASRARPDVDVLLVSYDLQIPDANPDAILPRVRKFLANRKIEMPVLVFEGDDFEGINERFDLPGQIPITLAIGKDGRIVDRCDGEASRARFDELLRAAAGS